MAFPANGEVNISHEKKNYGSMDLWWCLIAKNNYMFRPIAAIPAVLSYENKVDMWRMMSNSFRL